MKMRFVVAAWSALPFLFGSAQAQNPDYPQHPITIVVPSAPGGAADFTGRLIADRLAKQLGQSVIVENRAGANSTIGARLVQRAKPDGYTLLLTSESAMVISPVVMNELPYDALRDFKPISLAATLPLVLVTNPNTGIRSMQQLIDQAKKKPGQLRYASGGVASVHYFGMEILNQRVGIDMLHVPYKANPQALNDLLGGNIDIMLLAPGPASKLIAAGQLLALGVTSERPIPILPDVPPITTTVPGYEFEAWFGLFAPADTPNAIIQKLNKEMRALLDNKEFASKLVSAGIVPKSSSPNDLALRIEEDQHDLRKIVTSVRSTE